MKKAVRNRIWLCLVIMTLLAGLADPQAFQLAKADGGLPTASDIVQTLKTRHPDNGHPRILATADDFAAVRQNIENDPIANDIFQRLKSQADEILTNPLPQFSSGGLLQTSRTVLREIQTLGMIIQTYDGDTGPYLEKAWDILNAAAGFPHWNPSHFLDVAEMTMAFAVGYDWMYDQWTEPQREVIRNAIKDKGLTPALEAYHKGYTPDAAWWANVSFNWNSVVNGGIANGALAIVDEGPEYEDMAGELLELALEHIQNVLPTFAPDGGGEEGSGYWEYNNKYFVYYAATLFTALGTDYGLTDAEGVSETAYFPIYIAGPGGSFNYGNNYTEVVKDPLFFWYADRFGNDDYSKYRLDHLTTGTQPEPLDLLWYKPEMADDSYRLDLNLDQWFQNVNVGMMRSAWYDPNALFVGLKGGSNLYNHSHLDQGTFVLDALGVRWALDLGPGTTSLPNYYELVSGRSQYYRQRTEGHNTIVLNPESGDGQDYRAESKIVRTGSAPDQAFMIVDLSEAYAKHADSVQRGYALIDHRRQFLLQDEVSMHAPGEFFWFMHTRADISIEDDGKSAVLTMGDKKLWARILTEEADLSFTVRDPIPLPASINPAGQPDNTGTKLTIRGSGVKDLRLAVLFVPLLEWEEPPAQLPEVKPLAEWHVPAEDVARVSEITLDGNTLEGFGQDSFTYYVQWEDPAVEPVIDAIPAGPGVSVNVEMPESLPGAASIRVQSTDPSVRESEYRIVFSLPFNPNVSVSASSHDGNVPENTLDGNFGTRWSASSESGPQWILFKLTEPKVIDNVKIAFFNGHQRATIFDMFISPDGITWTEVFSGQSSGMTQELETFEFDPLTAQYIRIVGYGNTVNEWNSITEVEFDGKPTVAPPPDVFGGVEVQLAGGTLGIGQSAQLEVAAKMRSGNPVDMKEASVKYFTADPSIAVVDDEGVVTGVGYGDTKIWAEVTVNGYTKVGVANLTVDDGTISLLPTDDAHVRDGVYSNDNHGNYQQLETKNDNTTDFTRQAFMKFRLDSIDVPIASAKLLINAAVTESGQTEATLGIYAAEGEWTENTLTYNNRPEVGELLNSVTVTDQFQWHEIDITAYVQERLADDGIVNLSLHQRRDVDGTGKMIKINSIQHNDKPNLRLLPAQPQSADSGNNLLSVHSDTVDIGGSFTLNAIGDRQSEAGIVAGDERYVPIGWTSSETGKSGVFADQGGYSTATYTPSYPGEYEVTAVFVLQRWDGSDWTDAAETDTKSVSVTVLVPGENAAILNLKENERRPGEPFELTVSVTDVTYRFTAMETTIHFDPNVLEFETVQDDDETVLADSAIVSLNDSFVVTGAVRFDLGQIRVIAFTADSNAAVEQAASIFKLRGKVKDDADVDSTTTIKLSDVTVSFGDLGYPLIADYAAAVMQIAGWPAPVDKSGLAAAISEAEKVLEHAVIGTQPGQYPESAAKALEQAIEVAKAVHEQADADQEAVHQAAAKLKEAVQEFLNSEIQPDPSDPDPTDPTPTDPRPSPAIPADVSALSDAIEKARNLLDQAEIGEKVGQYPASAKSALEEAIKKAEAVRDSGTTSRTRVDEALSALESAMEQFSGEIITLVPGAGRITIRDLSVLAQYFGIDSSDPDWDKVAVADVNDTGVISIETLARVARMILDDWTEEQ